MPLVTYFVFCSGRSHKQKIAYRYSLFSFYAPNYIYLLHSLKISARKYFFKGNAQFVQKVTFEPLMDFKQKHYGSWKYYKSCYF